MVHALAEAHRTLRTGGQLIDLRPIVSRPTVDILSGEGEARAGRLDDSSEAPDDAACETAVRHATEQGWFQLQSSESFTFSLYWDGLQEMLEYLTDRWTGVEVPEELVLRAQRLVDRGVPPVQLRVQLTMSIASYGRLP